MKVKSLLFSLISYSLVPASMMSQDADPNVVSELELIDKYFGMSPEELFKVSTSLTTGSEQGWRENQFLRLRPVVNIISK